MSCADVMYQPYTSYLSSYQRPTPTATTVASIVSESAVAIHEHKKFGVPKMHEPLDPSGSGGSAEYTTGTGSSAAASASSSAAKDSTAAKVESQTADAQYISANCILITYYSGDISSVVDEHFTRALSQPSSYSAEPIKGLSTKDVSPMSQRNFPPSFWNSNYQPTPGSLASLGHPDLTYAADPYHAAAAAAGLHGLHQGDPWHYSLSSQATYSHRQMHDLAYSSVTSMPGTSRFNPQYSSILLQPSVRPTRLPPVPGQCTPLGKPSEAWGTPRYHDTITSDISHLDGNYSGSHTYTSMSNMAGLEGPVQDTAKDLYWF